MNPSTRWPSATFALNLALGKRTGFALKLPLRYRVVNAKIGAT